MFRIVHNDFARKVPPVFEIYSDKIVVTSAGGLPVEMTEEEFYQGFSSPRNRELIRVFKDVKLVEHIGPGIPRILKKYDRSIFNFTTNFLRVIFPLPVSVVERNEHISNVHSHEINMDKSPTNRVPICADRTPIGADGIPVSNVQHLKIIEYLRTHESITNTSVVILLGVNETRAKVILREMVELGLLEAQGEKRYRIYILKIQRS
jgi:predicted HTH transcriptional regulator